MSESPVQPMLLYWHNDPERAFVTVRLGDYPDNFAEVQLDTNGPKALQRLALWLMALFLLKPDTVVQVREWGQPCDPPTVARALALGTVTGAAP